MSKKPLISACVFAGFSLICVFFMNITLLFPFNKWIGVSVGLSLVVLNAIFSFLVFRLKKSKREIGKKQAFAIILINAIGCGIGISSLYVYFGWAPTVAESFVGIVPLIGAFFLYVLLSDVKLFRKHSIISLSVYCAVIIVGLVLGCIFFSQSVFSLSIALSLVFIGFMITCVLRDESEGEYIRHLVIFSFFIVFVVLLIVLIIISEGDGIDGVDAIPDGNKNKKRKH